MRYLKRFNESFDEILTDLTDGNFDSWIRIEDNVKDIFVEYSDSHDLDVVVGRGFLPTTVASLADNVIEVKLFEQRGIRYGDIADEVGMLIEYMKSLTDKEVKIYYDIDRSGLRHWRPYRYLSAGVSTEFDNYLKERGSMSFNTIRLYFVESGSKVTESLDIDYGKAIDDIDDIFVEMWDSGLNYLISKEGQDGIGIGIYKKKKNVVIDLDLLRDCVEATIEYLSDLGDFTQFYRFGYVWEGVNTKISNQGNEVNYKSTKRDNIEYSSFPYNFIDDVQNKHALEHRFDYELEGIKIVFKKK
jgi:hypothetical protein